jgi:hypothetical protein
MVPWQHCVVQGCPLWVISDIVTVDCDVCFAPRADIESCRAVSLLSRQWQRSDPVGRLRVARPRNWVAGRNDVPSELFLDNGAGRQRS